LEEPQAAANPKVAAAARAADRIEVVIPPAGIYEEA